MNLIWNTQRQKTSLLYRKWCISHSAEKASKFKWKRLKKQWKVQHWVCFIEHVETVLAWAGNIINSHQNQGSKKLQPLYLFRHVLCHSGMLTAGEVPPLRPGSYLHPVWQPNPWQRAAVASLDLQYIPVDFTKFYLEKQVPNCLWRQWGSVSTKTGIQYIVYLDQAS